MNVRGKMKFLCQCENDVGRRYTRWLFADS